MAGAPDPKQGKRILDKAASRRKLQAEGWRCRICTRLAQGCHHIIERGSPHFGDDVVDNLVPLCGSGTTGCHGLVEAFNPTICREFAECLTFDELAYIYRKLGIEAGDAYLERRYFVGRSVRA